MISSYLSIVNVDVAYSEYMDQKAYLQEQGIVDPAAVSEYMQANVFTEQFGQEQASRLEQDGVVDEATKSIFFAQMFQTLVMQCLLFAVPCIAITGPVQAGMAYVTRNWSRDEHAFIWSDFKDAVKENWKQGLGVSLITSVVPLLMYVCYQFYGERAGQSLLYIVPQMLTITVGLVWMLGVTFMYPMMVTYKVTFRQLIKNSLMLSVGRLPQTVGVRLLLLLPAVLLLLIFLATISFIPLLLLGAYYVLLGYALSRFVIASYTNAVFDRFINARMEGVQVNRGLAADPDDEDEDDEDEGKTPEA